MSLTRKDGAATLWTALAVLVLFANREAWNVPLVGDSVRWAAAVILVLGIAGCASGAETTGVDRTTMGALGMLGVATAAAGLIAFIWASETALALLTLGVVVLWAVATVRHMTHGSTGRAVHT